MWDGDNINVKPQRVTRTSPGMQKQKSIVMHYGQFSVMLYLPSLT